MKYLKKFDLHTGYNTYITGLDKILPNVSYCEDNDEVHYNPRIETKLIAHFNVTSTSSPTNIMYDTNTTKLLFNYIIIDGIKLNSITSTYLFETTGEHLVEYELNDITTIRGHTFRECTNLVKLYIPSTVTNIGSGIIYKSGIKASENFIIDKRNPVYVLDSVNKVIVNLTTNLLILGFEDTVSIPTYIISIEDYAFSFMKNLFSGETLMIPDNVVTIGTYSFYYCDKFNNLTLGSGINNIGTTCFAMCSGLNNNLTIPGNIKNISKSCFTGTNIKNLTLSEGVETIDEFAFNDCNYLSTINLPSSLVSIGDSAFRIVGGTNKLTSITCLATTAPTISYRTFGSTKANGTLHVPAGATGYDVWMGTDNYYLGKYNWTMVVDLSS